mmetsp:Transcript_19084/g.26427  ORF Transcript_19084/g.26427 Transcript_19084/m.26427 type:complete len:644 (+) Transcript_19084:302-2233(+)
MMCADWRVGRSIVLLGMLGLLKVNEIACATEAECPEGASGRVVVVGAGLAGMAAADALRQHGCDVTVLEAQAQLGGRAGTEEEGEFVGMDKGAHWLYGGMVNPVWRMLVEQAGAETVFVGGNRTLEGGRARLDLHATEGRGLTDAEVETSFRRFESLEAELDFYFQAGHEEDVSYAQGVRELSWQEPRMNWQDPMMNWHRSTRLELELGAREEGLSLRSYLREAPVSSYIERPGGLDEALVGGHAAVMRHLAIGLDIRRNSPVSRISVGEEHVEVGLASGGVVRGRAVIVTVPLGVLQQSIEGEGGGVGGIVFQPPLPEEKVEALRGLTMGPQIKVLLRFPSRFWPVGAYSLGHASLEHGEWPLFFSLGEGMLQATVGGDYAAALMQVPDGGVVAAAVKVLRGMYSGVSNPLASKVYRWGPQQPFSTGAKSYVPVGGSISAMSALSQPLSQQRVLFAGEATCARMYGTTHGAYVSGLREAKRLLGGVASTWAMFEGGLPELCDELPVSGAPSPPPDSSTPSNSSTFASSAEDSQTVNVSKAAWVGSPSWWVVAVAAAGLLISLGRLFTMEALQYVRKYGLLEVFYPSPPLDYTEMNEFPDEQDLLEEEKFDSPLVPTSVSIIRSLPDYGSRLSDPSGRLLYPI